MIEKLKDPSRAGELFKGWQETMIWSCLQNVMGEIYGDHPEHPSCAAAVLGDFSFFAGDPREELLRCSLQSRDMGFRILVPQNKAWAGMIEQCCGERTDKVTRYAFRKDPGTFQRENLESMAKALPPEYSLQMLDEELYDWCRCREWCRDWVSQYADYKAYEKHGLGVVITKDGVPVSGASSYSSYRGGIEIEIDTKEEYRRRGLARICGARLILECLGRGLYPSWDAQNPGSAALAKQLGYRMEGTYTAYEAGGL